MTIILYLIFSHLIFISSRTFLKNAFQKTFETKSEETVLMIIIQYVIALIFTYILIFFISVFLLKSISFSLFFDPSYFFYNLRRY